ncbi:MAG: Activator of Hsp90 ATPase-like protein [Caulobacter sp.]|nr:Activator of Hsp90 ATPase-like protein [Caulobacter sp.]
MFANAIGAEVRQYVEREHDGKPARVVVATRHYPTPPDDLWDALTDARRIPRWFLPIQGDLKLGGRYQLEGNAGGTITRCDPPVALDVTWEFGGGVSWVSVRLEPQGEGTLLTLEHIMLKSDMRDHWAQYGPAAVGVGWDLTIMGLGRYLATDEASWDKAAAAAWPASDEGKAYMRDSAEAWARAHIAGGEDPEIAHAMAARTAGFYTGG